MAMALGLDYWVVPSAATPYSGSLTMDETIAQTVADTLLQILTEKDLLSLTRPATKHQEL